MAHIALSKSNRYIVIVGLALLLVSLVINRANAQGLADSRFDLTGNGIIDDVDAAKVLDAWAALQEQGLCITPELADRDINRDGCVNIFDAQIVLAHWGERTRPEPPQPIVPAGGTTFTVNSSADNSDADLNDNLCATANAQCTLRAAIEQSNFSPGPETIEFNIGSCPSLVTIQLNQELLIDDPSDAGVVIDGYTQCGASPNTKSIGGNAVIKIQIKGIHKLDVRGLSIYSANNTVKGLALYNSDGDIYMRTKGAKNNTIQGNFIGTNVNYNSSAYGNGTFIQVGPRYNLIGGIRPAERNIIGRGTQDGLAFRGSRTIANVVIGNYFGVRQDGKTPLGQKADNIDIGEGTKYNWIGASPPGWVDPSASSTSAANWPPPGAAWPPSGWEEGDPVGPPYDPYDDNPSFVYDDRERNIISGAGRDGVEISHQSDTLYNYVLNNYIGLDVTGKIAVGNGEKGITLEDQPSWTFIFDNVIGNNGYQGIRFKTNNHYNHVVNNKIGVGPDGVTPMPNGWDEPNYGFQGAGIYVYGGGQHNLFVRNIIANHVLSGIHLHARLTDTHPYSTREVHYNTISQNSIYNNGRYGIELDEAGGVEPNQGIAKPQITSATTAVVSGTSCTPCTVEVFVAQVSDVFDLQGGEGKTYLATGTTDGSGNFLIPISGVSVGEKVTATVTDALGNTSEFSPNVEVTNSQTPIGHVLLNGGTGLQSAYSDVLAQFFAIDNVAVTHWRYRVDNANLSGVSWTTISSPGTPFEHAEVLSLSEGPHTVYAQYKDGDNNESAVYNATITVFNLANPGDFPNGAITINNGAAYTNNPNFNLQLIGPLYSKDMKIGESSSLNGSDWEPYAVQRSWALDNPPNQSELVDMYAKFTDVYGAETPIVNDNILYDPVAPTLTVSLDTGTKELDLSGSQDDNGGSGLGKMRIYDGNNDSGWISYPQPPDPPTYIWPGSDGTIIYVRLRDNAGNESTISSVVLLSEDGSPVGSVLLNGETNLQTTDSDVLAEFEAQDDQAVTDWRYSVDNDDLSGISWTPTPLHEPSFADFQILSLDDGFHTVYAQYKDNDGKESKVYNATITIGDGAGTLYLPIILREP